MKIDTTNEAHLIANDGCDLVRKSDGVNFGKEVFLGYTYYINDKKLEEPKIETMDDFEEILNKNNEEINNTIDENPYYKLPIQRSW